MLLDGQVKLTIGAVDTINAAEQVTGLWQEEVTVQVTVLEPPQAGGAEPPLLEIMALHPPLKLAKLNQAAYAASIADCD